MGIKRNLSGHTLESPKVGGELNPDPPRLPPPSPHPCYPVHISIMQLFERRSKFVKTSHERELWKQVTATYMSDEETESEGDGFVIRIPSWKSDLLNKVLSRLDKRYDAKRATSCSKPKENRKIGTCSTREVPEGIPKWAVKKVSSSSSVSTDVSPSSSTVIDRTPTSNPGHRRTARPIGLFNDGSSNDEGSEESDESDDELDPMIRAATMELC